MDNVKILSWNVRGLGARARRNVVRTLVDDVVADVVCVQESKLCAVTRDVVIAMLGMCFSDYADVVIAMLRMRFSDYASVPASGSRGGLIVAVRGPDISIADVLAGCYSVFVKLTGPRVGNPWWLTTVYGP